MSDIGRPGIAWFDGANESHNDSVRPSSNHHTLNVSVHDSSTEDTVSKVKRETSRIIVESNSFRPSPVDRPASELGTLTLWNKIWELSPTKSILTAIKTDKQRLTNSGKLENELKYPQRTWRTTFIRFGPLSGLCCVLLALASLVASLGILAGSNTQATDDWSVPPSTFLAIFTALANLFVRYAAINGVVISWWVRATRGSTLAKMHWDWKSGSTLRGALTAGRHMDLLGLACIFSVIVAIDGPLLQKASSVVPAPISRPPIPLNVRMAPQMPRGYTGDIGTWIDNKELGYPDPQCEMFNATVLGPDGPVSNYIMSSGYLVKEWKIVKPWLKRSPMENVVRGCPHVCKAQIRAPALFATKCVTNSFQTEYQARLDVRRIFYQDIAPPLENQAFSVASILNVHGEQEKLNLYTGYAEIVDCGGPFTYTTCTLEAGTGEYNVTIEENRLTLDTPVSPRFISLARNANVNRTFDENLQGHQSTLAMIAQESLDQWNNGVAIFHRPEGPPETLEFGNSVFQAYAAATPGDCATYSSPHEAVIESLNTLMVYFGAYAATESPSYLIPLLDSGAEVNTTINGYISGHHNVFHTNYLYFLGAAIVEVVCIALILPTYWGWWNLGRAVSFSPLEMAKAFDSPLLVDCNSNSSGSDLARATTDTKVKYGAVRIDDLGDQRKLKFGDSNQVEPTRDGLRFDV